MVADTEKCYVARTFFRVVPGSVSQAVRRTSRGARRRIFIRYGTVRLVSNLAVSRNRDTHAARRCQRSDDFAQRNTYLMRDGLATIMGAIKEWTSPSWSAQL